LQSKKRVNRLSRFLAGSNSIIHYLYLIKLQFFKMKLTIIIAFLSMTTFGQLTGKVKGLNITKTETINDTVIKVIYKNNIISRNPQPPAIFFNGKLIDYSLMSTINPESIGTMNVIKKDTIIDSVKYYGRIMIQGKTTNSHN
jgi:hypothetical protein